LRSGGTASRSTGTAPSTAVAPAADLPGIRWPFRPPARHHGGVIRPAEARLRPSDEIGRADWIRDRLVGFGLGVHSVVPGGFAAYVRVLHPAEGPPQERRLVRWAEVAQRTGVTMHGSIHFADLADALDRADADRWEVDEPEIGNLDPEPLAALCEVLARHTASPQACWFGVWDGHHWLPPAAAYAVFTRIAVDPDEPGRDAPAATEHPALSFVLTWADPSPPLPVVELPWREYRLLTGPLDAAREVGRLFNDVFDPHSPNLIWPDDHAWCVATDVDLASTYIAGPQALADELLADPRLEAWAVREDDPLS
jgi:hypothetical protein